MQLDVEVSPPAFVRTQLEVKCTCSVPESVAWGVWLERPSVAEYRLHGLCSASNLPSGHRLHWYTPYAVVSMQCTLHFGLGNILNDMGTICRGSICTISSVRSRYSIK